MPATGTTTMTTTQATREAGSRCGRRIARAMNARCTRTKRTVPSAVSIVCSVIANVFWEKPSGHCRGGVAGRQVSRDGEVRFQDCECRDHDGVRRAHLLVACALLELAICLERASVHTGSPQEGKGGLLALSPRHRGSSARIGRTTGPVE